MKPLQQVLAEDDQQKVAVGHFNVSDLVALRAVYLATRELNLPVLVGVSKGERDFIGVHQIAALVRSIREHHSFPTYLDADHTHSIEKACEAARHGMLKSMVEGEIKKHVDAARIAEIKRATRKRLTLHGGSGTDDEGFLDAIEAGITIIHVNTELRVAWRRRLESALARKPEEVAPYKLLPDVVESVKKVVYSRLRLFNLHQACSGTLNCHGRR